MLPTASTKPVGSPGLRPVRGATTKACSLEHVEEEQRRNGPSMGFPEGAGRFWATTASLVAHIPRAGFKTPREPRCERQAAGSQERRRWRIHSDTPRRSDAGKGGLPPQPGGLGGVASPRGAAFARGSETTPPFGCVARRQRSAPPATPPPRALRGWQLRPARPRGVLKPALRRAPFRRSDCARPQRRFGA